MEVDFNKTKLMIEPMMKTTHIEKTNKRRIIYKIRVIIIRIYYENISVEINIDVKDECKHIQVNKSENIQLK